MNKTYQIINLDLSLLNDLADTQTEDDVSSQLGGLLYNNLHDHYGGGVFDTFAKKIGSSLVATAADTVKTAGKEVVLGAVASGKKTLDRGRKKGRDMIEQIRERSPSLSPLARKVAQKGKDMAQQGIQRGKAMVQQGKQTAQTGMRQFIGKASNSATSSDENPDENPDENLDQDSEEDQPQLSSPSPPLYHKEKNPARSHKKSELHKSQQLAKPVVDTRSFLDGEIDTSPLPSPLPDHKKTIKGIQKLLGLTPTEAESIFNMSNAFKGEHNY